MHRYCRKKTHTAYAKGQIADVTADIVLPVSWLFAHSGTGTRENLRQSGEDGDGYCISDLDSVLHRAFQLNLYNDSEFLMKIK